jgi:large subunit ribosomal protein L23
MREPTNIVRTARITEKATALGEKSQYVFEVVPDATKQEIKYAVQQLFKKKVQRVNTMRVAGKRRRKRTAQEGRTRNWKKAIVTLQPGEKIELV